MPAIIMHAGAGVLLIIMTNFASYKPNNKNKKSQITITNHKIKQAPSLISASQISTPKNQLQKPIFTTDAPLHTTNLQLRCSTSK